MKLSGWVYVIVGTAIAIISAALYLKVPKNGEPNTSMAIFFFVGMIFILIGVAKLFFKRVDFAEEAKFDNEIQKLTNAHATAHDAQQHMHKVEAQLTKIYNQGHTSTYAQSHPYHEGKGEQNVSHAQNSAQHQTHTAQHPHALAQASHPMHHYTIVECPKCHTKNYTHSNYCHMCGHRLR